MLAETAAGSSSATKAPRSHAKSLDSTLAFSDEPTEAPPLRPPVTSLVEANAPPPPGLFSSQSDSDSAIRALEKLYQESDDAQKVAISKAMGLWRADPASEGLSKVLSSMSDLALGDIKNVLDTAGSIQTAITEEAITDLRLYDAVFEIANEAGDIALFVQLLLYSKYESLIWIAGTILVLEFVVRLMAGIFDLSSLTEPGGLRHFKAPPLRRYKEGTTWWQLAKALSCMMIEPNAAEIMYLDICRAENVSSAAVAEVETSEFVSTIQSAYTESVADDKSRRLLLFLFFLEDVPELGLEIAVAVLDSSQIGYVYFLSLFTTVFHLTRHAMASRSAAKRKGLAQQLDQQVNLVLEEGMSASELPLGPATQSVNLAALNWGNEGAAVLKLLEEVTTRAKHVKALILPSLRAEPHANIPREISPYLLVSKFPDGKGSFEKFATYGALMTARLQWVARELENEVKELGVEMSRLSALPKAKEVDGELESQSEADKVIGIQERKDKLAAKIEEVSKDLQRFKPTRHSSFRENAAKELERENDRYKRRMEKRLAAPPPPAFEPNEAVGDFNKKSEADAQKALWEKRRKAAALKAGASSSATEAGGSKAKKVPDPRPRGTSLDRTVT